MSSILTLEKLNASAATVLLAHPVQVPEFGPGMVAYIAELTADERDARLEVPWLNHKEQTGQKDNAGFRAFVAAACWCKSQLRDFECADEKAITEAAKVLGGRDSKPVDRMFKLAAKLNGLTEEEVAELEKN